MKHIILEWCLDWVCLTATHDAGNLKPSHYPARAVIDNDTMRVIAIEYHDDQVHSAANQK